MSPIRILHVFGRMGRGGAETWLMNVMRHMDRQRYAFDFLVHQPEPGEFDDEIRSLGGTIHVVPSYRDPLRYPRELGAVLRRGDYDIVHSHVSFYSGFILACARMLGIRARIAHSHTSVPEEYDPAWRWLYKRAMRASLHASATRGVGCSSKAVAALFGPGWRSRDKYDVLFYGYDFNRFSALTPELRAATRSSLDVAEGERIIGHIGRLVTPKNHPFILDLAAASRARGRTGERFVLVGDGELRPQIEQEIAARGLADKIVMTGQRSDIPALLCSFDVLILPSLWEGLPVTILEAQAAGIRCVMSDRVTDEVIVHNVLQRPLGDPDAWLAAIDELCARPPMPAQEALARMSRSPFGIEQHLVQVEQLYEEEAAR